MIATVSPTLPSESGRVRAVLGRRPIRTDVAVDVVVVEDVEGVPTGRVYKPAIESGFRGAAVLALCR